ncbi:MAG: phosphoserine phosphatase SerB, partial [Novosphingobium sp.]
MPIARLIAEPAVLSADLSAGVHALERAGIRVLSADPLTQVEEVVHFALEGGDAATVRRVLERQFDPADLLVTELVPQVPQVFVSDMDSTMIQAECIDELADFAGLKDQIAGITERAMQGELDFAEALTERVRLLGGLGEGAIAQCLAERVPPMAGAATLVATLKDHGCYT